MIVEIGVDTPSSEKHLKELGDNRWEAVSVWPLLSTIRILFNARAYELYEGRGSDGHAEEDWLQAESEVAGSKRTQCRPSLTITVTKKSLVKPIMVGPSRK